MGRALAYAPLWACLLAGPAATQAAIGDELPRVATLRVRNAWYGDRREVVRVSVPFARGRTKDLSAFAVRGYPTAWRTLTHWADGSVQWAQAQFVAELRGGATHSFEVVRGPGAMRPGTASRSSNALLDSLLRGAIGTEVEDPHGVVYTATLRPDPTAGPRGLLAATPLVRVYRFRDYHVAADPARPGIGRDYLSLTAYLTLFEGFGHGELLLCLGNDYLGADDPRGRDDPNLHPLGTVRLKRFSLVVRDPALAFVPRWIRENGLRPPEPLSSSDGRPAGWRQHLLGPAAGLYLADACVKRFPIVLYAPSGNRARPPTDPAEVLRRQTATAMAEAPLYGLPDVDDVRRTRAFGAHGGPAPATPAVQRLAAATFARWRDTPHFGPFGTWGDVAFSRTTGTPRNGTSGLHLGLRAGSGPLMIAAEGFCLQQGLRPYHLWRLDAARDDLVLDGLPLFAGGRWRSKETLGRSRLPPATNDYRKGLTLPPGGPYRMNPFDYDHFSVDVLYDFYCLTGSSFARDELDVLGQQLVSMLRARTEHLTTRGEGWCMQALVLCWLATGNDALAAFARGRLQVLEAGRGSPPGGYALAQDPDPRALGPGVGWDAPWQQAAYVLGMSAAFRYFEDPRFAKLAVDVARWMARQGWADGVGPKYFVSVADPARYTLPEGYGPLDGTALFESPAFVVAAELAGEAGLAEDRDLFLDRAWRIFDAHAANGVDALAANKWFQVHLDRFPRGRPHR